MAQARYLLGAPEPEACFTLTFRTNPFQGGFAVCAGIGLVLDFLSDWRFSDSDLAYLRTLKARDGSMLFEQPFLTHLKQLSFSCSIDAVQEGRVVFAGEPIVRVTGPVSLCQMIETPLLNIINFSTLIATKAARCVLAACGDEVLEFGLRRAQGPDGGLMASRAAYVGGVDATSNTEAGKRYGIPVAGTHAHSWVMSFPDELEAFRAYVKTSANNATLLVDTYNTLQGVRHAITVAHEMETDGKKLSGIRIDSGDLAWLSKRARQMLDDAGLDYVRIVASNSLDEYTVLSLKEQGAAVDAWGIGTQMVTGGSYSALDGVYKMTAIKDESGRWIPRMKISEQLVKATLPGMQGLRRFYDEQGMMDGDMVYEDNLPSSFYSASLDKEMTMVDPMDITRSKSFGVGTSYEEMLVSMMDNGLRVDGIEQNDSSDMRTPATLDQARERLRADMLRLDESRKRFLRPHVYPVGIEEGLNAQRIVLMKELREGVDG